MSENSDKIITLGGLQTVYEDINSTLNTLVKKSDVQSNKLVIPTTSQQIIKANETGKVFLEQVTVNAIPDQKTKVTETLSVSTTAAQTITIPAGYYTEASTVTLPKQNAVTISSTSITPSTSTQTVTVSAGWNAAADTITINKMEGGSYSAEVATHTITSPTITPRTYGSVLNIVEFSQPAGVDGEDYYTISVGQAGATTGSSKATAKATVSTAGYIASGNKTSIESSKTINATLNPPAALFYVKSNGAVNKTLDSATTSYTVPAGYHNGSGKVSISVASLDAVKNAVNGSGGGYVGQ